MATTSEMTNPERDQMLRDVSASVQQILWQIKGNEYPQIEGLIPAQQRIEQRICDLSDDVAKIQAKEKARGTFTIKTLLHAVAWFIGVLGTIGGLFSVYFQIFGTH